MTAIPTFSPSYVASVNPSEASSTFWMELLPESSSAAASDDTTASIDTLSTSGSTHSAASSSPRTVAVKALSTRVIRVDVIATLLRAVLDAADCPDLTLTITRFSDPSPLSAARCST